MAGRDHQTPPGKTHAPRAAFQRNVVMMETLAVHHGDRAVVVRGRNVDLKSGIARSQGDRQAMGNKKGRIIQHYQQAGLAHDVARICSCHAWNISVAQSVPE